MNRILASCLMGVLCQKAAAGWTITPADSPVQVDLATALVATLWFAERPAPALLEMEDAAFFAPRLHLEGNAVFGDHWFFHAALRADRGFDPGSKPDGDLRLDEVLLRWRPTDDQRFNLQIGSFPTVFGAWQGNHGFFDDPFLLPPLPYSQIIGIQTRDPAAMSAAAIAARDTGLAAPVAELEKSNWASMVWGPAYGTGAAVFGATRHFDYAAEIKNSGLSSHPDSWSGNGFSDPSVAVRLGWRPDAAWALGLSASRGPWLEDNTPGVDRSDLPQTNLGLDLRWAHRDLIVTGELIGAEFETPAAGDLRALSGFVGARWKFAPGLWLASRAGGLIANDADNGAEWQAGVLRAEVAAGWWATPELLVKAGYAYTHTDDDGSAANHLFGLGFGWRF